MRRRQVFVDEAGSVAMTLPITPASYTWGHGLSAETVNIDGLGDIVLPGKDTLFEAKIECVFPAQHYSYLEALAEIVPGYYVYQFAKWICVKRILRYIVTGTLINVPVLLTDFSYGEEDGTNNVHATITIKEYRAPEALFEGAEAGAGGENALRGSDTAATTAQDYTIKKGDCLMAISRKFYGDSKYYKALARVNGIKNANLIYTGATLKIPALADLQG